MTLNPPIGPDAIKGETEVMQRVLYWLRGDLPAQPFNGLTELEYVEVPTDVVPPGKGNVLDQLFPPDNLLKIRVKRRFDGDQLKSYRLCASGLVGMVTVGEETNAGISATVTVQPKVPGSSLLTMLSYALVPDLTSKHHPNIDIQDMPIVSLILLIYLRQLQQLIEDYGLQRAYIRLEEPLQGTVRGRCVLPTYLQRNIPTGKAHIVPCDFWELRIDSQPNRALRWGIEVCRGIADWLSHPDLIREIENLWRTLAPEFASIPIVPCQSVDVRRLPRSGRFVPYTPALELLEFLLDHLSLNIEMGQVHVRGFAVEMWNIFERFVVNVLAHYMDGQVQGPQVKFSYEVRDGKRTLTKKYIYLDAIIKSQKTLVLDAKWKEGITSNDSTQTESETLQLEDLHIHNADLFQVIAYGYHKNVEAQGSLLVYPVLEAESVCRKRYIPNFSGLQSESQVFPVFLIGIPVGETLHKSIRNFINIVQDIATGSDISSKYHTIP